MKKMLHFVMLIVFGFLLSACESQWITKSEALYAEVPDESEEDILVHKKLMLSNDARLFRNKKLVYDMWRTLRDAHNTELAQPYFARNYIEHDPNFNTGREGMLDGMKIEEEPLPIPVRILGNVVAIIAERDLVVLVQEKKHKKPFPYTSFRFDMFRVKSGKIIEHWNHGTLEQKESLANYSPVKVNVSPENAMNSESEVLMANKKMVYDMTRNIIDARYLYVIDDFMAEDFVHHNPNGASDLNGFKALYQKKTPEPIRIKSELDGFIEIVAEGDLVVLATKKEYVIEDTPYSTTWFSMSKIQNNKIVEYWDSTRLP